MLTIEYIKKEIEPLAMEYGIKKVYVFGSYAKGLEREESDVDLLIEKAPHMTLINLSSFLQRAMEVLQTPVDIALTSGITEEFNNHIGDDRVLIYEEQG